MTTAQIVFVGGALGLVGYALVKYFSQDFSISPTTGGVNLPANAVYGPPVVAPDQTSPVTPGPIVEDLN